MNITSKQVKDFWAHMGKVYGFSVVQKATSKEMNAVAWALDAMGINDKKSFMENYTTTIGSVVYVPFEIGKGNWRQLINQVITCVHECEHVLQYARDGKRFMVNYISSDAARTHYEVEAYRTNMEMYFYFHGKILSPGLLSRSLEGYGVGEIDIQIAKKHLIISSKVIRHGAVISGVSKYAIKYWKKLEKQTGITRKIASIQQ